MVVCKKCFGEKHVFNGIDYVTCTHCQGTGEDPYVTTEEIDLDEFDDIQDFPDYLEGLDTNFNEYSDEETD